MKPAKYIYPAIICFLTLNIYKAFTFRQILSFSHLDLSHAAFFLGTTTISIIAVYLLLFKSKSRFPLLLFYLIQTAYIYVNISYFIYFNNYLYLRQAIDLFTQGIDIFRNGAMPNNMRTVCISLIDIPFALFLMRNYSQAREALAGFNKLINFLIVVFTTVLLMVNISSYYKESLPSIRDYKWTGDQRVVVVYGLLPLTIYDLFAGDNSALIAKLKPSNNIVSSDTRPLLSNFILVQVESLDSNIINTKYKGKYIMPFLSNLSRNSVYFPYMMSFHKGGGTSDCEFSILNSIEPLDNYPAIKLTRYRYPNSFIKQLSLSGYSVQAFHGNTGNFWNRLQAFAAMGFDNFFDLRKMGLMVYGWGARDQDVLNFTLKNSFAGKKNNFFHHIITMSSHTPFIYAANYYNNADFIDVPDIETKNYFNSLSYVDKCLEDFIGKATKKKDTYILIYGDHAPGISNKLFRQSSSEFDNKRLEFVPLLIVTPNNRAEKIRLVASFLDIAPTVLSASGISFQYHTSGENLLRTRSSITSKISFRGRSFDRKLFFNLIDKEFSK